MQPQYYKTRMVMVTLLFALLLSACGLKDARPGVVKATHEAVDMKALDAAKNLTANGNATALQVAAIAAVLDKVPDAFMVYNSAKDLAVYAAPITNAGVTAWQVTFLDTARVAIVSSERIIGELGGVPSEIKTVGEMKAFLSGAGFKEVSVLGAMMAEVTSSARLAMGFLRSIGSYNVTIVVIPGYFFDPAVNPFVQDTSNQQ
jgi:hypothetical protein